MNAVSTAPAGPDMLTQTPLGVVPPYSLEPVQFSLPAIADAAGSAALGGDREMALATFMVARLMLATLPPAPLSQSERAVRADRTRNWLSALAMPQPARMALLRCIDASVGAGLEAAASLRELGQVLTGHLTSTALRELTALADQLRLYYEQTPPTDT